MILKEKIYDVLTAAFSNGITEDAAFDEAVRVSADVIKRICDFCEEHDLALESGSEWLYQSDDAQVDALELVACILDDLADYSDFEE